MADATTNQINPTAGAAAGQTRANANQGGKTTIEDGVVGKVAGIAAREVKGVYALGGGAARAVGAVRDMFNSTDLSQGINVEVGEREAAVDITIVAEYPQPLQEVANNVRTSITRAIQEIVGLRVTEVNVTVNDVHIPGDEDENNSKSSDDDRSSSRVQ